MVEIKETATIAAPVERVFAAASDPNEQLRLGDRMRWRRVRLRRHLTAHYPTSAVPRDRAMGPRTGTRRQYHRSVLTVNFRDNASPPSSTVWFLNPVSACSIALRMIEASASGRAARTVSMSSRHET